MSEDLALTVLAPASFTSPPSSVCLTSPNSPMSIERVSVERHANGPQTFSIDDDVIPSFALCCTHFCGCRVEFHSGNKSPTPSSLFLYFWIVLKLILIISLFGSSQMYSSSIYSHHQAWATSTDWWHNYTWHITDRRKGKRYWSLQPLTLLYLLYCMPEFPPKKY